MPRHMQWRYEDDFVEGAVFAWAAKVEPSGLPGWQLKAFHAERERLYRILDAEERNEGFFRLHLTWFRKWGLEKALFDRVNEFPLLRTALRSLVWRKACRAPEEGAELYVSAENGRTGVVTLRVERFQEEDLASFLRPELMHLQDMVDPGFGYSPQLHLSWHNAAQKRLTQERYRLLWAITIAGRLARNFPAAGAQRVAQEHAFQRAFDFWPQGKRAEVFERLWNEPQPVHGNLLTLASDPRGANHAIGAFPGSPCPLCGFPTFAWATAAVISEPLVRVIRKEFPEWSAEQGLCERCARVYGALRSAPVAVL